MEPIFLIGFMGTGKTTVGQLLGKLLGRPSIELDQQIIASAGKEIPQIFAEDGEAVFRKLETAALTDLTSNQKVVVSTGGGIILNPENVTFMRRTGKVLRLAASPESIFSRIKTDGTRPLLGSSSGIESIRQLLAEREETYQHAAHWTVITDGKSPKEVAREIQELLQLGCPVDQPDSLQQKQRTDPLAKTLGRE